MIENVHISSFKSFANENIPLSNLTLLAGLNNSGKSSIIQSIRMYAAAFNGGSALLDGHGDIDDIRSKFVNPNSDVVIQLHTSNGNRGEMCLSHSDATPPKFCPEFIYVGADRLGPQAFLPLNFSVDNSPRIGDRGEYTIDLIARFTKNNFLVPDHLNHANSKGKTFEYALKGWLTEIAPGTEIKFETNKKAGITHAEIDSFRPANVGFGLSYTLPIIAATLGVNAYPATLEEQDTWVSQWVNRKKENGILLVLENPEAHLHPQGQTAIGKLIASAASESVQIIVETHSEHVMDGIRMAVKAKSISNNDVLFHYLSKDSEGKSVLETPSLKEDGKLEFWPKGFFDQTLKNRATLAKRN